MASLFVGLLVFFGPAFVVCNILIISDRVIRRSNRSASARWTKFSFRALQKEYVGKKTRKNIKPILIENFSGQIEYIPHIGRVIMKAVRTFVPTRDIDFSSSSLIEGRTTTSLTGARLRVLSTSLLIMRDHIRSGTSGWLRMRGSSTIRSGDRQRMICSARSTAPRCVFSACLTTRMTKAPEQRTEKRVSRRKFMSICKTFLRPPSKLFEVGIRTLYVGKAHRDTLAMENVNPMKNWSDAMKVRH